MNSRSKRTAVRIGVDLGGTKIEAMAMDAAGNELLRRRIPTPRDDYTATVEAVAGLVGTLESQLRVEARVGIGTPGAVSPATGLIKNANSVCLNGRPLGDDLARALGRAVRLANDANCLALSEAVDGAAAGASPVFAVIVGTGTGGGIVVDGKLLVGANAVAGEWGHNPLPWPRDDERPGAACYCGRRGCIETFLSGSGLQRDYAAAAGRALTAEAIAGRAEEGDIYAKAAMDRYTNRMARALATVINVVDPQVIVLGGGLSNVECLYAQVPRQWPEYVFSDRVATRLVAPRYGDASGVRGAARLWSVEEIGEE